NGYALAHATHYAKLEVVVVHVKFEGIKQIDVGVDVVSEEIAEMIVDKKELEEVKGTARDKKEVEKEVSDAEDVDVFSEDVDELDEEEVKGTARDKKKVHKEVFDAEEGKCHV
ncbi:hypothetical protein Tco_1487623, partial [Tanacetum coccineum]